MVEVSLVTMPPKRIIELLFRASTKLTCRPIENETAADEVEGGREGVIKIKFPILLWDSPTPTSYFVSPPLHFWRIAYIA